MSGVLSSTFDKDVKDSVLDPKAKSNPSTML